LEEAFAIAPIYWPKEHLAWWHQYYPASFITFEDSPLETFYWTQIYKFASASRQDKPLVDLQGPWAVEKTPWPVIWFNLNTQLTYSWQCAANRSELTQPLWQALEDYKGNLTKNVTDVPGQETWTDAITISRSTTYNLYRPLNPALTVHNNQYEVGNMTWLLYYYWQYCTYNHKEEVLTAQFFDLLKRAINYYFHIRYLGDDLHYHLPSTASPEYGGDEIGTDVNYDLSLLRWGLQTLLDINQKYNLQDSKANDWQDFLSRLTAYPEDPETGYKLSAKKAFDSSHRHYSHLLMIYPLYLVNWDTPADRAIITKSVNRWQSLTGALQGYSFTGSAAMYASMGDGDKALRQLNHLLARYIQKNTLYKESGPVFETPMAAVASLQDLYLQSWGDKIRVFPAVPSTWSRASFIDLRAAGAFLISARREEGATVFIQVKSEAGGLCRLQTGMELTKLQLQTLSGDLLPYEVVDRSSGLIEIHTAPGDVFQLIKTF
jgi:hypothetical protein